MPVSSMRLDQAKRSVPLPCPRQPCCGPRLGQRAPWSANRPVRIQHLYAGQRGCAEDGTPRCPRQDVLT
jgi:hypothetical protein